MPTTPRLRGTRPAQQAGRFYEADEHQLRQTIEQLLAASPVVNATAPAFAILSPHAGYLYSGHVAAEAYRAVRGQPIDRVLLLGPSHYHAFMGAAVPTHEAFATPLGAVAVDQEAAGLLEGKPYFQALNEAHETEHSLEVQLPFLQVALARDFAVLPVTLGRPPEVGLEPIAQELSAVLGGWRQAGRQWLIVASSDTYHGYDRTACEVNDQRLIELIKTMDERRLLEGFERRELMACGWVGLMLAVNLARRWGAQRGHPLKRSDSRAITGGSGGYVVGYIAAAFR